MGGASARQLQSCCKIYSWFCKSRKMYIQLRVPTYNHNYFVLHCCFGFSASARNDVTARASSWLVNAARISGKVQIFQLAKKRKIRAIRAASFARIAPQDCLSRLCIDLTCKSFARFVIRVWCERTFREIGLSLRNIILESHTANKTIWTLKRQMLSSCIVKKEYKLDYKFLNMAAGHEFLTRFITI